MSDFIPPEKIKTLTYLGITRKSSGRTSIGETLYKYRCTCGDEFYCNEYRLLRGWATCRGHNRKVDNVQEGDTFGKWTVLRTNIGMTKGGGRLHLCRCVCGKEERVRGTQLRNDLSRGCRPCCNLQHGYSRSDTHNHWVYLRRICNSPNDRQYKKFGALGISLCKEWEEDFLVFLKDMGEKKKGYVIERHDPKNDFSKSNCYWRKSLNLTSPTISTIVGKPYNVERGGSKPINDAMKTLDSLGNDLPPY